MRHPKGYTKTYKYKMNQKYTSLNSYIKDKFSKQKYNSKRRGIDWSLTIENIFFLLEEQEGECAVTGIKMTHFKHDKVKDNQVGRGVDTNVSFDRIDSSKGYTLNNVRLVCYAVNWMKNTLTDKKFKVWARAIYRGL